VLSTFQEGICRIATFGNHQLKKILKIRWREEQAQEMHKNIKDSNTG
jgi:hypothetical protein